MKLKVLAIGFLFGFMNCFGQYTISNDVNDTLSIEKIGKKIELENDLAKCEKWNNQILSVIKYRKNIQNLHPKIKEFYRNSYQASIITSAYLEEQKGNVSKSINIHLNILKELEQEKKKNYKLLGFVYRAIGSSFAFQQEFEKSKYYFLKALPFAIKNNNQDNIGHLYNSLGYIFNKLNKPKLALSYYSKSTSINKQLKNFASLGTNLNNIAQIYVQNKNYQLAYSNYHEAILYSSKVEDFEQLAITYLSLFRLKEKINDKQATIEYLKKAYKFANQSKDLQTRLYTTDALYEYYKKNNQKEIALKFLEENLKIDKIINKAENKNAILKAEFKYETEKKEAQIKTLSQQKQIAKLQSERQKTGLLLLAIAILSILISGYLLFKRYKTNKQNELLRVQLLESSKTFEAEKKAAESELKALKSQMNPHFIFNALNGIQEQFMFGDKVVANEQMGNFTTLTRQILSVSGKKKIPLSLEIDILTKYLELEKMRFETDFEYSITFDENIDDEYTELPPMLIQPFVENAVKHGLLHKTGHKKLSVFFEISSNEAYLHCTIQDNGVGRLKSAEIKANNKSSHQSFSTASIGQRLDILKTDGNNDDLVVYADILNENAEVNGTRVLLKIPI